MEASTSNTDLEAFQSALSALVASASSLNAGVESLKGPLEQDIRDAAEACWSLEAKSVQVRSKFLLRTRTVTVTEASFVEEAERGLLGSALAEWLRAAEGAVASTALEVRLAERRLLRTIHLALKGGGGRDTEAALTVLERLLAALAYMGQPKKGGVTTSYELVRSLAMMTGCHILSLAPDSQGSAGTELLALLEVIRKHAARVPFAAALMQPTAAQLPGLLPAILSQASPPSGDTDEAPSAADSLKARTLLLRQAPWEDVAALEPEAVRQGILNPLAGYADLLSRGQREPSPEWTEAVTGLTGALLVLAERVPDLRRDALGVVLLILLSLARGCSVYAALQGLGVSMAPKVKLSSLQSAGAVEWAQLVWKCTSSSQRDAAPVIALVQGLPWQQIASQLPDCMRLRALMTLLAVAKVSRQPGKGRGLAAWLWDLLDSQVGEVLTSIRNGDAEAAVADEAHIICMSQAPEGQTDVIALWAWTQLNLALSLLELWPRQTPDPSPNRLAPASLQPLEHAFRLKPEPASPAPSQDVAQQTVSPVQPFSNDSEVRTPGTAKKALESEAERREANGTEAQPGSETMIPGSTEGEGEGSQKYAEGQGSQKDAEGAARAADGHAGQQGAGSGGLRREGSGRAALFLEGMQFWSLPGVLLEAGQAGAVGKVLLRAFNVLHALGDEVYRSQVAPLARVLAAALEADPFGGKAIINPIREQITAEVLAGIDAAEAEAPAPQLEGETATGKVPHKQYHAPAKREKTTSPGAEVLAKAAHLAALLATAALLHPQFPKSASMLLRDLVQLLYYFAQSAVGGQAAGGGEGADNVAEAPKDLIAQCAGSIVAAIGQSSVPRLFSKLMELEAGNSRDLQWLAVLACWLSEAAGPSLPSGSGRSQSPGSPPPDAAHLLAGPESGGGAAERLRAGPLGQGGAGRSALDRSAEEAFQIQEAAIACGYNGAALPLWEEFLLRFFPFQPQLQAVVPVAEISAHLAELAQLYEAPSPLLSNIYALMAPLSPESLPGETPRFLDENPAVVRALMQLHPLHLTESAKKPPLAKTGGGTSNAGAAKSGSKDEQGTTKAGGAAMERTQSGTPKRQRSVRFADLPAETWSHGDTPRANGRPAAAAGDGSAGRQPVVSQEAFAGMLDEQEKLQADLAAAETAVREWIESMGSSRLLVPSPGSREDGTLPECVSLALNALWVAQSRWAEEMDSVQAGIREIVCRRYHNVDLKGVEAGDYGEAEEITCQEDPSYGPHLEANRQRAVAAVDAYAAGKEVARAASLLYQVEVLLLKQADASGKARAGSVGIQRPLLEALIDTILDAGNPAVSNPFLTALCQQVVPLVLNSSDESRADVRVQLVSRIVSALAAGSRGGSERDGEAAVLLTMVLDGPALLADKQLAVFGQCLCAVLEGCARGLTSQAVGNLLACFDVAGFAAQLLDGGGQSGLPRPQVSPMRHGHYSGSPPPPEAPENVAELLGLAAAMLALPGGEHASAALLAGILGLGANSRARRGSQDSSSEGASGDAGLRQELFAAALAVALMAGSWEAREVVLEPLRREDFHAKIALPVVQECIAQITEAIHAHTLSPPHIPYSLLGSLIRSPAAIASLRNHIAGSSQPPSQAHPIAGLWTARISASTPSSSAAQTPETSPQESPLQPQGSSSNQEHGIGSVGYKRETLSSSHLAMLLPVPPRGATGEVVEGLLGACLQAMLEKFGSGLEGTALTTEFSSLLALVMEPAAEHPWLVDWLWGPVYRTHLRPFLTLAGSASGGATITSFRHFWACLPWARATFHAISPDAIADLGSHIMNADRAVLQLLHALDWAPVLRQLGHVSSKDPQVAREGCRWGTQLCCLALRAHILLTPSELPNWLQAMLETSPQMGTPAADLLSEDVGAVPSLVDVIANLDKQGVEELKSVLCSCVGGVPFLLQPLVVSPTLVLGDPGKRLVHISRLLKNAAERDASPKVAALAAAAMRTMLFVSVTRTFGEAEALLNSEGGGSGGVELGECWQLTDDHHTEIVSQYLIPLARQHASLDLARRARGERHGAGTLLDIDRGGAAGASKWRPPQLTQLAGRLGSNAAPPSPEAQRWGDRPTPMRPDPSGLAAALADAALPIAALLDCLSDSACSTLQTADPLPFANAQRPLRLSESSGSMGESPAPASLGSLELADGSPTFLQQSMARFRQRLDGGAHLPAESAAAAAAAPKAGTSARALQIRLAETLRDECARHPDLALCVLRILLTSYSLRKAILPSALQEAVFLTVVTAMSNSSADSQPPSPTIVQQPAQIPERQRSGSEQELGVAAAEASAQQLASSAWDNGAQLGTIFEGLAEGELMGICHDAAVGREPLTQAAASEALRRLVLGQERAAWRVLALETVKMASDAEARQDAAHHILALWLIMLAWVGDVRWQSSQSAASEVLEGFLDSMQRHADLLREGPAEGLGPGPGMEENDADSKPKALHTAAERLQGMKASLQARLTRDSNALPKDSPQSSNMSNFGGHDLPAWPDQEPAPQDKVSKRLAGFGKGLKRAVAQARGKKDSELPADADFDPEPARPGRASMFFKGRKGPSQLPTIHSDNESEGTGGGLPSPSKAWREFGQMLGRDSGRARSEKDSFTGERPAAVMVPDSSGGSQAQAPDSPRGAGGFLGKARERLRKGLTREKDRAELEAAELEHLKELIAVEESVALGLASVAVQAYLKSVLCPSLSDYHPRAKISNFQYAGGGLSSRQSSLGAGMDSRKSSLGALNGPVPGFVMHGHNDSVASIASIRSTGAVVDENLMRELDQVLEARTELDSLDEILKSPLVAMNMQRWAPFFAATPRLLSSATSVEAFQRDIIALLFPNAPYLNFSRHW